ncbi:ELKS/Rab6-interacting/CAST family member 1-like [Vespula pensylvanica]|uniref:ELKS/Rab6-interacting/CAST family member 1-like n=1 Tax=Vespula pensylvanica TaxID=30213 RepID=UPI001CB9EF2A|nr:ELKS/Rab6-interacting/CAST family member 1-like [Vespula pensylvanica]
MCNSLLVTRLTELNQQLATIAKLQKMEDEYDKNPILCCKICDCQHHILSTGENKKKIPCNINTCKTRKRCTCNKTRKCKFFINIDIINNYLLLFITSLVLDTRLENVQDLEKIHSIRKQITQENMNNDISAKRDTNHSEKHESVSRNIDNQNTENENEIMRKANDTVLIYQDLSNEKKQKKDLEEKLQNAKQHSTKLKENGEQPISYLKDALQKAEEQLAQAKKETITVTADRDKLLKTISTLKEEMENAVCKNVSLHRECQDLKCKLQIASECETKTCTVVQDEVNLIKSIVKQKEEILQAEIIELKGLIAELTNVTKIQERRICELSIICKKQQCSLRDKSKTIIEKESKIFEMQSLLKSYSCKCTGMQNDIQKLESSLNKESNTCNSLKEELERCKDDYNCMLNIKTKIIEEQDETIKKQKRLLKDSENMAEQAASEFEEIRNELVHEKETCESLRIALITAEVQLNQEYNVECKNCQNLMEEINLLDQQKQKSLIAAKETLRKLCVSVRDYQRELVFERQQCKFLTLKLKEKQEEVEYIKKEYAHKKGPIVRRTSDFLY